MASGDTLLVFDARSGTPPATNPATFDTITGGDGTSAETLLVLAFDDTTDEYADFYGVMPESYADGGLTVTLVFTHSHASTGPTWGVMFRAVPDDAEDFDTTDHDYSTNEQTVAAGAPSVVGEFGYDNTTHTDGVQTDNIAAGDFFVMRVRRDALTDSTGDAYLVSVHIKET